MSRVAPDPDALPASGPASRSPESKSAPRTPASRRLNRADDLSWARVPAAHLKSDVRGKLIKAPTAGRRSIAGVELPLMPAMDFGLNVLGSKKRDIGVTPARYKFREHTIGPAAAEGSPARIRPASPVR